MELRDVTLRDWQQTAVDAWVRNDHTGTIEVVTGGGKTVIALACVERASQTAPGLKVAVVVPTTALARQWADVIEAMTDIPREQIGVLGAGRKNSLDDHRVVISVLNTQPRRFPRWLPAINP